MYQKEKISHKKIKIKKKKICVYKNYILSKKKKKERSKTDSWYCNHFLNCRCLSDSVKVLMSSLFCSLLITAAPNLGIISAGKGGGDEWTTLICPATWISAKVQRPLLRPGTVEHGFFVEPFTGPLCSSVLAALVFSILNTRRINVVNKNNFIMLLLPIINLCDQNFKRRENGLARDFNEGGM